MVRDKVKEGIEGCLNKDDGGRPTVQGGAAKWAWWLIRGVVEV